MRQEREPRRGIGYWLTILLALVVMIIGAWLLIGGVWLISLAGSPYYAIAGALLILTAILLFRGDQLAIPVYLLAFLFTLIWALWESGGDGWAQVPRLLGPVIVLILVLLTNPVLRAIHPMDWRTRRLPRGAVTAASAIVVGLALVPGTLHSRATAQDAPTTASISEPIDSMAKVGGVDWPVYGGSNLETRYSALNEITPDNVGKLKQVWKYRTGDLPENQPDPEALKDKYSPETTPIKIGDTLYLCSARDIILAVDAGSGKEAWRYDPQISNGNIPYGATCRGVSYYAVANAQPGQPCANRIVEGTMDARLIEVDAKTGRLCADFGQDGQVDLLKGIGRTVPGWYGSNVPPMIVRNVIVMGAQVQDGMDEDAPSGVIRGYDVVSGKFLWAWDMGRPGVTTEPGPDETYTRGTPNMWTAAAGDDQLGLVYAPLGNSSVDYFGGNRKPYENEYNSSVVAIDVTTGKDVWHFQTVHYDVWDYDLGSQPSLFDYPSDSGPVPALLLPSKQGQFYVLDRKTGKPLTPVEERPVPRTGSVEPDRLSNTQPFSGYNSVVKPDLVESDMWGATPFDQLMCRISFKSMRYDGLFTAPDTDVSLSFPGSLGGMNWGGLSTDPTTNTIFVNDMRLGLWIQMQEAAPTKAVASGGESVNTGMGVVPMKGTPYAVNKNRFLSALGIPCQAPPYGTMTAIDMKTQKIKWQVPVGTVEDTGPLGIKMGLPIPIGMPTLGGTLATQGGLIFIAGTQDYYLRAFDTATGKEVWKARLPVGSQGGPMSYKSPKTGKQYIVISAGGARQSPDRGDYVIAYALPG